MRALKLAGVLTCSLALSATTAVAAPQVLDDDALDGVVAGFVLFPGIGETQAIGFPQFVFLPLAPTVTPPPVIYQERGPEVVEQTAGGGLTSTSTISGQGTQEALNAARQDPPPVAPPFIPTIPFPFPFPTTNFP